MIPFPLASIVIALVIVGLLLWVVGQIPIDPAIQKIIRVVVIVCVCLWLFDLFVGSAGSLGVPLIRH